jgi:predicted Zn-dependent peptidase
MRLLRAQAQHIDPVDLERARNQLAVRSMRAQEQPVVRLEAAAQDLFALQRIRSRAELMAELNAVSAEQVRAEFARMLSLPASIAIAGKVARGTTDRVRDIVAASGG